MFVQCRAVVQSPGNRCRNHSTATCTAQGHAWSPPASGSSPSPAKNLNLPAAVPVVWSWSCPPTIPACLPPRLHLLQFGSPFPWSQDMPFLLEARVPTPRAWSPSPAAAASSSSAKGYYCCLPGVGAFVSTFSICVITACYSSGLQLATLHSAHSKTATTLPKTITLAMNGTARASATEAMACPSAPALGTAAWCKPVNVGTPYTPVDATPPDFHCTKKRSRVVN